MEDNSFKFEFKIEVELKEGRLNTRICASDEELSDTAKQVMVAYMAVICNAIAERKPFGKGDAEIEEVEE
jgi:hypothetical protein